MVRTIMDHIGDALNDSGLQRRHVVGLQCNSRVQVLYLLLIDRRKRVTTRKLPQIAAVRFSHFTFGALAELCGDSFTRRFRNVTTADMSGFRKTPSSDLATFTLTRTGIAPLARSA